MIITIPKYPLISVIIPTYNRTHVLPRAIKSVISQSYQNFEIIVIDDCSTDNSIDVVSSFKDKRVKLIRHDVNRGASAARNTGIKNSNGKYIAFLDSDDEWLPDKLEKQIKIFQNASDKVGVVYTGWRWINDKNKKILQEIIPAYRGDISGIILKEDNIGSLSTPLVKKEVLLAVNCLDEYLPSRQDWDLWIRLSKKCEFDYVPEILVNYYLQIGSISSSLPNKIKGTIRIFEKYKNEFSSHPEILSNHYVLLTILYLILNDIEKSRFYMRMSVSLNPLNLRVYWKFLVHYILSFTPMKFRKWFFRTMRHINKDFYWIYPLT